jgi:hypothetical protein
MSNTMWGGRQHGARHARVRWYSRPWGWWITASIARYALTVAIFAVFCAVTRHLQRLTHPSPWQFGTVALIVVIGTALQARRRS